MLNSKSEERHTLFELGTQNEIVLVKAGYDIDATKKTENYTQNKINSEFKIGNSDFIFRTLYSIWNKKLRSNLSGDFSLDNLGYIFSEDYTSFGYEGIEKNQTYEMHTSLLIFPNINFANGMSLNNGGIFTNNSTIYMRV